MGNLNGLLNLIISVDIRLQSDSVDGNTSSQMEIETSNNKDIPLEFHIKNCIS